MSLETNRLVRTFEKLGEANKKTLLPFLTAGHPDLDATLALLKEFEVRGAKICELGVPFSDPIADGPTIQGSYIQALERGVTPGKVFETVRRYRQDGGQMALLAMVSFSIVYRYGVRDFIQAAAGAGFDGLIIPDMSLEEADNLSTLCDQAGLCNVMLVTPNTPEQRKLRIASYSTGFLYYVSVSGTTGERTSLPQSTIDGVAKLRRQTASPICVGFGISSAELVRTVCAAADGAIVGSAIVKRISQAADQPREQMVRQVGDFVEELLSGTE